MAKGIVMVTAMIEVKNQRKDQVKMQMNQEIQTKMMKKIRICTNNFSYNPDDFPITFYFLAVQRISVDLH
jgi:hypothetical protein